MTNDNSQTSESDNFTEILEESNLHRQENIVQLLEQEFQELGFAGSPTLPQLVYLTLLTGMLERPVSLLIKGPSGAGKSFSLRMGKEFIPKDAYVEFEGMSEKAILYLKDLSLKNKHLIIGEASGMADGTGRVMLRQLLSEGQARYATVESTDGGIKGTELPALEGPTGLIMTTTAPAIHHEDENRMLSLDIRESPEQIEAALLAQAERSSRSKKEPDTTAWFALYNYMKASPKDVFIPYAKEIARRLPRSHDKVKRDFPQLLSLIEASALLHSFTRERTEAGEVIATLDDYRIVRELTEQAISRGLAKTVTDSVRTLVEEVGKHRNTGIGLSVSRLAVLLSRDISVVSRTATMAVKEGFLIDTNPGQGRISQLVIGDIPLPSGSALPTPEELEAAMKQAEDNDRQAA